MTVRLLVENYRGLRQIAWELPAGVCSLVGPNGSGKTTLLDVPVLLRDLTRATFGDAFRRHGTYEGLCNLRAPRGATVKVGLVFDSLSWMVEVAFDQGVPRFSESFPGAQQSLWPFDDARPQFPGLMVDSEILCDRLPFHEYRLYSGYRLDDVRRKGSPSSAEVALAPDGANLFSVLRNWDGKRATKERFAFVTESLREAFPDAFEGLDFEPANDGTVSARIVAPGADPALPALYAPSGLLTALLHLTAVASAPEGGIVAIDEPENGLHPFAIKRLVTATRDWAAEKRLTVLFATHSPMLLDQFREDPERLFVMEPGREVLPVRLDQVHDREWLSRFSLGDLYKAGDFGAPREGAAA